MGLAALCFGAYLAGWLLPELVLLHSQRSGVIPLGINFACAFAGAFIAFGLRA